jgi:hypothetical protein
LSMLSDGLAIQLLVSSGWVTSVIVTKDAKGIRYVLRVSYVYGVGVGTRNLYKNNQTYRRLYHVKFARAFFTRNDVQG